MGEYQIKVPLKGEAEITAVGAIKGQNFNAGEYSVFCTGIDYNGDRPAAAFNSSSANIPCIQAVQTAMTRAGIQNVGGSIRPIGVQTSVVTLTRR